MDIDLMTIAVITILVALIMFWRSYRTEKKVRGDINQIKAAVDQMVHDNQSYVVSLAGDNEICYNVFRVFRFNNYAGFYYTDIAMVSECELFGIEPGDEFKSAQLMPATKKLAISKNGKDDWIYLPITIHPIKGNERCHVVEIDKEAE